jgi:hypothetical protein
MEVTRIRCGIVNAVVVVASRGLQSRFRGACLMGSYRRDA